jgi:hypothetical protein
MVNLAQLYAEGKGVAQNQREASRWYAKAAELGDANAFYNLGIRYYRGIGVPQDFKTAAKWFRRAADQVQMDYDPGHGLINDDEQLDD